MTDALLPGFAGVAQLGRRRDPGSRTNLRLVFPFTLFAKARKAPKQAPEIYRPKNNCSSYSSSRHYHLPPFSSLVLVAMELPDLSICGRKLTNRVTTNRMNIMEAAQTG